jgi:hypothetical protein
MPFPNEVSCPVPVPPKKLRFIQRNLRFLPFFSPKKKERNGISKSGAVQKTYYMEGRSFWIVGWEQGEGGSSPLWEGAVFLELSFSFLFFFFYEKKKEEKRREGFYEKKAYRTGGS